MLSLVEQTPGYFSSGKDLDVKLAEAEELAADAEPPGTVVATVGESGDSVCAPAAQAWLFPDGSANLYDHNSGVCVNLDEAGFDGWALLQQPQDSWPQGLATSEFVAELTGLGLVQNRE